MRITKGSRVEVMNKKEVPVSWRAAEVLSGNGHTYCVRYDHQPVGLLMGRVSRRRVRPCPPLLLSDDECRELGDTVEVFDNLSWKIAVILKVLPGDNYMVRLLGCSAVSIVVNRLNVRDLLMGKGSGARGKIGSEKRLQERSRSLKRAAPCLPSVTESYAGNSNKRRAVEKDNRRHKMATPLGVREVFAASDEPITTKLDFFAGFCSQDLDSSDSHSIASSVGSCSINSMGQEESPKYYEQVVGQESNCLCSDAESSSNDNEASYSDGVVGSSHDMELETYRRTLLSLHASGPLSWEQESVLTNLRINLNVSDDEHLTEIRAN